MAFDMAFKELFGLHPENRVSEFSAASASVFGWVGAAASVSRLATACSPYSRKADLGRP